jgi:hypothetical protein
MSQEKYWTDNIWKWVCIKMGGGPGPEDVIVLKDEETGNKKVVAAYDRETAEKYMIEGQKYIPHTKAISLYNSYKHNIVFEKIDGEKNV